MKQSVSRLNTAGQSTRMMAEGRKLNRRRLGLAGFICLGLILLLIWTNFHFFRIWVFLFCLLVCVLGLITVRRGIIPVMDFLKKREEQAVQGAEGEEAVGAILDRLPNMHQVQHDVPGAN